MKTPQKVLRATEQEKAEMLAFVADEEEFYFQESQSPGANGATTVMFQKFNWGYGYMEMHLFDTGEFIQWPVEFSRCSYCKTIITTGTGSHDYCPECGIEWETA